MKSTITVKTVTYSSIDLRMVKVFKFFLSSDTEMRKTNNATTMFVTFFNRLYIATGFTKGKIEGLESLLPQHL